MAKLKIQYVAETYPPEYGGGAAIYVQDIARGMAARGHEVRVLCVENADREQYTLRTENDRDVLVERINLPYLKTQDPEGWFLSQAEWKKHEKRIAEIVGTMVSAWRPDIVHYNTTRPLGEEYLISLKRHGVPVIAMLHDAWLICPRVMLLHSPDSMPCVGPSTMRCLSCLYSNYDGSWTKMVPKLPWRIAKLGTYPAYRLKRRSVARGSINGVMGHSHFMLGHHEPFVPGEVRYVPLGINLEGLPPSRNIRPRTPTRFGFVAGFQPTKGIWDVLYAAEALKRSGLSFELHIWGPGVEGKATEIVKRNLEDRVFLRGAYAAGDLWKAFDEIDIAVMATTVCEPFGRVPLEARAMGAPTIAPAIGGITESIRDEVDGLLYRFRDRAHLERQMRRVLEEPGLAQRLIENQGAVMNTADQIGAVEDYYRSVLASQQVNVQGSGIRDQGSGVRGQGSGVSGQG